MATEVFLRDVRIAFTDTAKGGIWTPGGDGKKAYSCTLLLSPDDTTQVSNLINAITIEAQEKWKEKAPAILASLWATDKVCMHNGDLKAQFDGFSGMYAISARSYTMPLIIGRRREILTKETGRPYSGCYVIGHIEIWAQDDKDYGKRVNAGLKGIQYVRDGDAFAAGAPSDPSAFDDLGVEDSSSIV